MPKQGWMPWRSIQQLLYMGLRGHSNKQTASINLVWYWTCVSFNQMGGHDYCPVFIGMERVGCSLQLVCSLFRAKAVTNQADVTWFNLWACQAHVWQCLNLRIQLAGLHFFVEPMQVCAYTVCCHHTRLCLIHMAIGTYFPEAVISQTHKSCTHILTQILQYNCHTSS